MTYAKSSPLDARLQPGHDAGPKAKTVRDYLLALLTKLLDTTDGFSGKRPFGNSGWDKHIIKAWIKSNHLKGELDEDGGLVDYNPRRYWKLIELSMKELRDGRVQAPALEVSE